MAGVLFSSGTLRREISSEASLREAKNGCAEFDRVSLTWTNCHDASASDFAVVFNYEFTLSRQASTSDFFASRNSMGRVAHRTHNLSDVRRKHTRATSLRLYAHDPFSHLTVVVSTRDVGNRKVAFEAPMLVCEAYVCTISTSSRDTDLRAVNNNSEISENSGKALMCRSFR